MSFSTEVVGVSVVIPCYNAGATLLETIESVERQTWPKVEVLVVDDGSDDEVTIQILERVISHKVIRQSNRGLSNARNIGFENAKYSLVIPLDADDCLDPTALEVLALAIGGSKSTFVFSDIMMFGERNGLYRTNHNLFEQLFVNRLPYCMLLPKKIWQQVGRYDENMREGYEDWDFNIRLGLAGFHGLRVTSPVFRYRVTSDGMLSKSRNIHNRLWKTIQEKYADIYTVSGMWKIWVVSKENKALNNPAELIGLFILSRFLPNFFGSMLFSLIFKLRFFVRKKTKGI